MDWLENHQIIQWELPEDMAAKELSEKYKLAADSEDFSIYTEARHNVESEKISNSFNTITEEQAAHNNKINRILDKAWELLDQKSKRSLLDLQPAGNDFMNVIDDRIKSENSYSDDYMNYQVKNNSLLLWKLRLQTAVRIGKNFVKKLTKAFLDNVIMPEDTDPDYLEVFDLYTAYS
jgi:ABC-type antimicrobial peptide transport system permease subunit